MSLSYTPSPTVTSTALNSALAPAFDLKLDPCQPPYEAWTILVSQSGSQSISHLIPPIRKSVSQVNQSVTWSLQFVHDRSLA